MSIKHQLEVQGVIESLQRAISIMKRYDSQSLPSTDSTEWAKAIIQVIYYDEHVGGVITGLFDELSLSMAPELQEGDMK